jgi:hypothetical protein
MRMILVAAALALAVTAIALSSTLTDLRVVLDPEKSLKSVMKDGIIYKNELN